MLSYLRSVFSGIGHCLRTQLFWCTSNCQDLHSTVWGVWDSWISYGHRVMVLLWITWFYLRSVLSRQHLINSSSDKTSQIWGNMFKEAVVWNIVWSSFSYIHQKRCSPALKCCSSDFHSLCWPHFTIWVLYEEYLIISKSDSCDVMKSPVRWWVVPLWPLILRQQIDSPLFQLSPQNHQILHCRCMCTILFLSPRCKKFCIKISL